MITCLLMCITCSVADFSFHINYSNSWANYSNYSNSFPNKNFKLSFFVGNE